MTEAERAARRDREKAQRRARWATVGVLLIGLAALAGALYEKRETDKRETLVLTSAAARASADQRYETAMRVALHGLPVPGSPPLALGWSTQEIRGLEAKLGGAAQLSSLLRRLKSGRGAVSSAAFSPDGGRIVTASTDGTALVWDPASGEMLRELQGQGDAVAPADVRVGELEGATSAAFSPDGGRIVVASGDGTARVWDAANGEMLRTLKGHADGVKSVAFSPDGTRIVTASYDQSARVWDAATGEMLRELGHGDLVTSAAFSPDGARIITASLDRKARVWDAVTGEMLRELEGHGIGLSSAAFSPDGALIVTASGDRTARVWNAATGALLLELKRLVNSAAFSPDGTRIVTASIDRTVTADPFEA